VAEGEGRGLCRAAGHELEVVQGDARTAPAQVVELHVALDRAVLGLPRDDVGACPAMERVAVLIAPARGELAAEHRVALGTHGARRSFPLAARLAAHHPSSSSSTRSLSVTSLSSISSGGATLAGIC